MSNSDGNSAIKYRLLIHSASQIVQISKNGEKYLRGKNMKNLSVLNQEENGEGFSLIVGKDGKIVAIDKDSVIQKNYFGAEYDNVINATGQCLLPGLVDAHTHPVWAGDRVHEFAMKLAGATYMEVHKAGGGINFTVEKTRAASEEELYLSLKERLSRMLRSGTTLAEVKSGYGLDLNSELKLLRVLTKASQASQTELSITYCGAHAIPVGSTAEEATDEIIHKHLPQIDHLRNTGEILVNNIDVFCEDGVFNTEQSKRILTAGQAKGLLSNFHGDELHPMKAAELAAEIEATAISHVECISDEGIDALAKTETIAVLLPTTAYILRLKSPPVKKMIESGVIVALGTDFNPNAFCLSMPLAMNLACLLYNMSMEEALVAGTLNAAASINKSTTHGSLEIGKLGNIIILNAPRWEHLIYQMAGHDHVIKHVVIKGKICY